MGWRRLRPWGLGIAVCAVVLVRLGEWVGTAVVALIWLGYLLFARLDRCRVADCDQPVSGLLGACYPHRGVKWRSPPRLVRGGRLGLRLVWRRAAVPVAAGDVRAAPRVPYSAPRRRLMDAAGLVGLVLAVLSVVSALVAG